MSQILSVIVKEAMNQTGLIQFGNRPRFFDPSKPINVRDMNMQIWSGFKTVAYKYQNGCSLILDNCARFMSTKTVLHLINDVYDNVMNNQDYRNK